MAPIVEQSQEAHPLNDGSLNSFVETLSTKPEIFFTPPASLLDDILSNSRIYFQLSKSDEPFPGAFGPLTELTVDGFTNDQVWEIIQLQNEPLMQFVEESVEDLLNCQNEHPEQSDSERDEEDEEKNETISDTESVDNHDDLLSLNSDMDEAKLDNDVADTVDINEAEDEEDRVRRRILEDGLGSDLEENDDDGLALDSDNDFDDEDMDADEEAAEMTYKDFFGEEPVQHDADPKMIGDLGSEDSEDDVDGNEELETKISNLFAADAEDDGNDSQEKSTFEKEQEKLQNLVKKLEEENVEDKSWALKGEVASKKRPLNSLLEEDLEFDTVKKPVPIITEEVTSTLEDLIRQRIVDKAFDDVERKVRMETREFKPRGEISDEKSKASLAEIYEEEYIKNVSHEKSDKVSEELKKKHDDIQNLFKNICFKLDSLSNFYFTPKPPKPEITVVPDVPAITLEEVIPSTVNDASLKAPEEVYDKKKEDLKGETELTKSEKDKKRKHKKLGKKQRAIEKRKQTEVIENHHPERLQGKSKMAKKRAIDDLVNADNVTFITTSTSSLKRQKRDKDDVKSSNLKL